MMPGFNSARQEMCDKYITWAARLILTAHRMEANGGDAKRFYQMAEQAKLKADLLLA